MIRLAQLYYSLIEETCFYEILLIPPPRFAPLKLMPLYITGHGVACLRFVANSR